MKKIAYIIPGFTENIKDKGYREVVKSFEARNYQAVLVRISWKYKVMSDYVDEFLDQVTHNNNDKACFFGFSFGAMIALISATRLDIQSLFLFSLSPFFKEDLKNLPKYIKKDIGKKRLEDFEKYSFKELAEQINCRTILAAGEREHRYLLGRVEDAHNKIKESELFIINKAKHNISQKEYRNKLREIIAASDI